VYYVRSVHFCCFVYASSLMLFTHIKCNLSAKFSISKLWLVSAVYNIKINPTYKSYPITCKLEWSQSNVFSRFRQ